MKKIWFAVVAAALLTPGLARATEYSTSTVASPHYQTQNLFLFTDHKARQRGDLITVVVMESAQASKKVSNKTNKKSGTTMDMGITTDSSNNKNNLKLNNDTKYQGDSSTERRGSLVARMTATIQDVMPNGNLIISGKQLINISGEKQTLSVYGIARPEDVDSSNTVLSSYLADAKIEFSGKETRSWWMHILGPVGWFYNWLF